MWKWSVEKVPHDNQQTLVEIVKRSMCVTESGEWYFLELRHQKVKPMCQITV